MSINASGSIQSGAWNGQTIDISKGGTGATSAQTAINLLSQVSLATSGHVLTKDVATGNATWKAITSTTFALPDGGVASPALYFTSDTNTGLYRAANDIIAFTANGQPALTVSGQSGVGQLCVGDSAFVGYSLSSRFQIIDNNNNAASGITLGAGSGAVQLYKSANNNLTILASTQSKITASKNTVALSLTDTNSKGISFIPDVGTGGYNPASVDGDQAIIFTSGPTGTGSLVLAAHSNTAGGIRINSSGEVSVCGSTDNGAYNLQCNGTGVWGAGAYVNGSDERIKENVQPLGNTLDIVNQLNPVTYNYKETWCKDQSTQPGFIAQEVANTLTQTTYAAGVVQQSGNYLGLAYQNLIPLLVKAVQELDAKNKLLEEKIAQLEAK
jgi:hypothetical protein